MKRASGSLSWSRCTSGGHRASLTNTCETRRRPMKRSRTRSSKSLPTSERTARRGRSKSGLHAYLSMAASTVGKPGAAAIAGSLAPQSRRPTRLALLPRRRQPTRNTGCSRVNAGRAWRRQSIGSTAGSGRFSC